MPEFDGLGGFIVSLPGLAARLRAAGQRGRQAAVDIVRAEIVATFDEPPGSDTGPFPGWAALTDATRAARARHGLAADQQEVATGALRDSVSGAVEPDGRAAVGVADRIVGSGQPGDGFRDIGDVAVAQEEGTGRLPQRSFLGLGAFRAAPKAAQAFAAPVLAALAGLPPDRSSEGGAPHGDD